MPDRKKALIAGATGVVGRSRSQSATASAIGQRSVAGGHTIM